MQSLIDDEQAEKITEKFKFITLESQDKVI